ncbi:MAG: CAP domain-containing protein [Streptococcaceae bacterium]|jgi:uncharacterized protein YkwD|nr:CAP domain-containing protein [Streptococcaceae bacterium]
MFNTKKRKLILATLFILAGAVIVLQSSGIFSWLRPQTGGEGTSLVTLKVVDEKDKVLWTEDYHFTKNQTAKIRLPDIPNYSMKQNKSKTFNVWVGADNRIIQKYTYVKTVKTTVQLVDSKNKVLKTVNFKAASNSSLKKNLPAVKGYMRRSGKTVSVPFSNKDTTFKVKLEKAFKTTVNIVDKNSKKKLRTLSFTNVGNSVMRANLPMIKNYIVENDGPLVQNINIKNKNTTKIIYYVTFESAVAKEALRLINNERNKIGRSTLKINSTLYKGANLRADEIISKFSHSRPNGNKFFTATTDKQIKGDRQYIGENLAKMPLKQKAKQQASEVFKAWKNSPAHKYVYSHKQVTSCNFGFAIKGTTLYICNWFY